MTQTTLIDMPGKENFEDKISLKYSWEKQAGFRSVDVELYGRSLLGFGKIFKKISKQFLETNVELQVITEKNGSLETIIHFFSREEVIACATAMQILSFFGLDHRALRKLPSFILNLLIEIIRASKGKKDKIKKIVSELKLTETLREKIIKLFDNIEFRSCLDEMTVFLVTKDMKSLTVSQPECPESIINKADRPSFVAQPEDEVTVEYSEKLVSVTYLSPEKSRWQFKTKNFEFWATVTDILFLEGMHGKRLEDIIDLRFIATVKKTTTKEANTKNTKTEREIYSFHPEQKQASLLAT